MNLTNCIGKILSHSDYSKKLNSKLLLALIDFEFDIVFYEISEILN